MAFVIAVGMKVTGEREVLGFDLGTRRRRFILADLSAEPGGKRAKGRQTGD